MPSREALWSWEAFMEPQLGHYQIATKRWRDHEVVIWLLPGIRYCNHIHEVLNNGYLPEDLPQR